MNIINVTIMPPKKIDSMISLSINDHNQLQFPT